MGNRQGGDRNARIAPELKAGGRFKAYRPEEEGCRMAPVVKPSRKVERMLGAWERALEAYAILEDTHNKSMCDEPFTC